MAGQETRVIIHSFGEVPEVSLPDLAAGVSASFRVQALPGPGLPLPGDAFDGRRRQYRSASFLAALAGLRDPPAADSQVFCRLGITGVDLFIPRLNFVFGEADVARRVAVVSVCRLRPRFYGRPPDSGLLRERVLKEAVHELGHVFGLSHCDSPGCIMRVSNSVGDTDAKGPGFCRQCLVNLSAGGIDAA